MVEVAGRLRGVQYVRKTWPVSPQKSEPSTFASGFPSTADEPTAGAATSSATQRLIGWRAPHWIWRFSPSPLWRRWNRPRELTSMRGCTPSSPRRCFYAGVSDARGSQLIDFTSQHGLAVLNDPLSPPTYETAYVSSWIDVTLATPALLSGGYSWEVSWDDSLSEHRYIQVSIGSDTRSRVRRLTRVGLHDLNASLVRDPWFRVVQGAVLRSPTALDLVLSKFHQIYGRAYKRNLRPDKSSYRSKPWWTPQLAAERKGVLAMRRRFQRCHDELLRQQFRSEYSAALALSVHM
ncbi:hypothetical protein HPB49_012595 [Dermacentor silvarum]|uniref:Uncharacterized protein n=1 Tax=Dermacentor silvarum TaxID=543639 RepID=A0ACB8C3L8_DERSI|nr:hypothetical protein HPB49_012595 [Dermacentor silvarum]